MPEPEQLRNGRLFHKQVQEDFEKNTKAGVAIPEKSISLKELKNIRQKSGRMDIFVDELGNFVTIIEIKGTDWDRIKTKNIKRNLYMHQKQIFMYIDKYVDIEKSDVCLGIIYPKPPKKEGLRELIENYLEEYGLPVYWYNEIKTD